MKVKLVFLFLGLIMAYPSPDLSSIRVKYPEASKNEQEAKKLHDELISISKNDIPVLIAYKGAVTTMMAKYAQGIKDKKRFFKEGKELLEHAVETEPDNIEIRCIRLSVQENTPKIMGYRKNISEDKKSILDSYPSITDKGAKDFIKGYVAQSDAFSDIEKQLF